MLISELLDGLADRLRCIDGLTVSVDPSATVSVPMAVVTDGEVGYHETMTPRNLYRVDAVVTVYISRADNEQGALESRSYRSNHGDLSIPAALETSTGTLDPLNDVNTIVTNTSTAGVVTSVGGESYYGARFEITAHIPGATS